MRRDAPRSATCRRSRRRRPWRTGSGSRHADCPADRRSADSIWSARKPALSPAPARHSPASASWFGYSYWYSWPSPSRLLSGWESHPWEHHHDTREYRDDRNRQDEQKEERQRGARDEIGILAAHGL